MDSDEIKQLQARVQRLEGRVRELEQKLGVGVQSRAVTQPSPRQPVSRPAPAQAPRQRKPRESWEQRIGGTWLNRLGVVAVLFGLAFFLKYAFDNNWINELGRVVMGYLAGALFLAGGLWFRRKLPKFAAGLGGAAIGAWFITTWAASNFYQILGQTPAFAVMVGITVAGMVLALHWHSPTLAGLGLLGGYITPLLIQGAGGYLTQFVYLLILNLGALAVLVKKNWNGLAFISLGFTILLNAIALITLYEPSFLTPFMLFLSAYHLLFAIQGLAGNFVHRSPVRPPLLGISLISGCFYAVFSAILLFQNTTTLATIIFAWGIFYLAQMFVVQHWRREDRNLSFVLLCLALGYIILAIPILLSLAWITMAWGILAGILICAGWKTGKASWRGWGLGILVLALFRLIIFDLQLIFPISWVADSYSSPWTARLPATLLVVAVIALAAWLYRSKVSKFEERLVPWLAATANILILTFVLGEWSRWFYELGQTSPDYMWRLYRASAWSFTMLINLGVLLALWMRWKYRFLKVLVLIGLPVAMSWSVLADIRIFSGNLFTAASYIPPWVGRLPAALLLAFLAFMAVRQFSKEGKGLNWLVICANFLILFAILTEFSRYYSVFRQTLAQPWQVYRNTAWSAVMSIHGFVLVAVGIWRKKVLLRRMGIALLLSTVAKITLVDLTGLETAWRILVFIGTGTILIIASWLYQKYVGTSLEKEL